MVRDNVSRRGDQPGTQIGLGTALVPERLQETDKYLAGNVLGGVGIIEPVANVPIDFCEVLVVNGAYDLRVIRSQADQGWIVKVLHTFAGPPAITVKREKSVHAQYIILISRPRRATP